MIVGEFSAMQVIEIDAALIRRAIGVCRRSRISYWDALVVAAAKRARCSRILSEDLRPGQSYDGGIRRQSLLGVCPRNNVLNDMRH